jgi:anti-sigma regulatory factor (Ser/Thr protein kinase)
MSDDSSGLLMTLPARAENVAVVRHAIAGLAEQLGMEEVGVGDLKTVVTEACMNVVVHAYDERSGPLQVQAVPEERGLTVVVRDFGSGIRPRTDVERPSLRLGLTLIAALSSSFEISGGLNRGTEIRMHVPFVAESRTAAAPPAEFEIADSTKLTIGDPELIAPVLGRVVAALAARHQITVDRLSDATLFTDALSERAPDAFTDGHFCFTVSDGEHGVDLRVGPVPAGASETLRKGLAVPEVGGSLEILADEIRVEDTDGGEYLLVRFAVTPT